MESLRILMVTPSVMIPENLAQSIHQWEYSRWLSTFGHEVHLICRRPKDSGHVDIDPDYQGVYYHKVLSADFPLKRIFFTLDARRMATSILGTDSFDLIHDRGYLFGGAGLHAGMAKGLPTLLQIDDHWVKTEAQASKIAKTMLYQKKSEDWCKWALAHCNRAFTVSNRLRDVAVEEWGGQAERISVIPNGVDVESFSPEAKPLGLKKRYGIGNGKVVMFIGALGPWHGVDNLIRAVPFIKREHPDTYFFIIGGAKEYPSNKLEDMTKSKGLSDSVFFVGRIPSKDVPGALAEADVTVAPYPEIDFGFSPFKIFEYMASGRATVTSDLESIREILEHNKTGILTQCWQPEALADAISCLLSDEQKRLRLGRDARRVAETKFTWEASTHRLEGLYKKLLSS